MEAEQAEDSRGSAPGIGTQGSGKVCHVSTAEEADHGVADGRRPWRERTSGQRSMAANRLGPLILGCRSPVSPALSSLESPCIQLAVHGFAQRASCPVLLALLALLVRLPLQGVLIALVHASPAAPQAAARASKG